MDSVYCFLLVIICSTILFTNAYELEEIEAASWKALLRYSSADSHTEGVENGFVTLVTKLRENLKENGQNFTCENDEKSSVCAHQISACSSPEELFNLLPNSTKTFHGAIARLCPILLSQVFDGFGCHNQLQESKPKTRPSTAAVWGLGILCITVISACSLVGVIILPVLNKDLYKNLLMLFEGLAVGSLASSAVFHLIPQAFNLLGQDAEHDYLWKAAIIFCGIYVFFVSEHLMKILIDAKKHKRTKQETNSKCLLAPTAYKVDSLEKDHGSSITFINTLVKDKNNDEMVDNLSTRLSLRRASDETEISLPYHNHDHGFPFQSNSGNNIATVAWMIIFGDGLHNFIDGLSIGAAFSESILAGISISVAVVCEEFPHELGDFAVLLNAGMTMKQALGYNFISACTCYIGFIFGVLLGDLAEGSYYIFAFAGGMFLYIALVDMMGELNEAIKEAQSKGVRKTLKVFILQNLGIWIGVILLFVLARYSEKINFESFEQTGETPAELLDSVV